MTIIKRVKEQLKTVPIFGTVSHYAAELPLNEVPEMTLDQRINAQVVGVTHVLTWVIDAREFDSKESMEELESALVTS